MVISNRKGKVFFLEIITNASEFYLDKKTAAAIGKFDGIHIGHRRLLEEILTLKKDGLAACVFTFDPLPAIFFGACGERERAETMAAAQSSDAMPDPVAASCKMMLYTRQEKRILFERMGVDILIEFPLNQETASIPPVDFVTDILMGQMNVRFLAAGKDLSFGAKGAGNGALLRKLGPRLGFDFKDIDKVCLEGREVSSTRVRSQVVKGHMEEAARLLGMPYMIAGRVETGNKIGRTIGFPTINIFPDEGKLLPPNGVYFSLVCWRGKEYPAVSNIGCKPTVSEEGKVGVESWLYDFEEDIYGEEVEVYLCAFHRPEQRFEGLEQLRGQLMKDIAAGAEFHGDRF